MLTITGEATREVSFTFDQLSELPGQVPDVGAEVEGRKGHGVRLKSLIDQAGRKASASHATLASTDGAFTASVPLDDILDAILVYRHDGGPLAEELGGPIRFLIPDAAACHTGGADTCANVKHLGRIELTAGKVEDARDRMEPDHA